MVNLAQHEALKEYRAREHAEYNYHSKHKFCGESQSLNPNQILAPEKRQGATSGLARPLGAVVALWPIGRKDAIKRERRGHRSAHGAGLQQQQQ